MKILALNKASDEKVIESAIDLWRVHRPLEELKKHVDWQIDYQPKVIKNQDGYKDPDKFFKERGRAEVDNLGQYDIIFTSYFPSPHAYTLLWAANKHHGTKLIMDVDDDLFGIDPWNPFWLKAGKTGVHFIQRMAQITKYISTTSDYLAQRLTDFSEVEGQKVFVNPNYIGDSYQHPPFDNGDRIIIGYFGGSSHYRDVHHTNFVAALRRIMFKHKNVYFEIMGQPLDDYLPRKRVKVMEPVKGTDWPLKAFPQLNYDIAIAPLMDTVFSKGKSDIKWQEATRMGAAVIASNVGPYRYIPKGTAKLVDNTEEQWYEALESLLDAQKRRKQVERAQKALEGYRIEDHWQSYKKMFEEVYNDENN